MGSIKVKRFETADEVLPFEGKGRVEVVRLAGREAGRATFEPGWRWSENVKPIARTASCEFPHLGYVVSGRMRTVFFIPPGHDAEVVGHDPCVMIDFAREDADHARYE